jgi:mRNA interferase MazF
MTNYKAGDVVLVEFIFSEQEGSKRRPALVVSSELYNKSRHEVIVAAITSNIDRKLIGETILKNWKDDGLLHPSTVTAIIQTIRTNLITKKIGTLTTIDLTSVKINLLKAMQLV